VTAPLGRRLLAEGVATATLVMVVVGSGIAAQRLSPADPGLQLLENSTATVLGLAVVILVFGPVSGAHLNPLVSAVDWLLGRRTRDGLPGRDALGYGAAQTVGAIVGAVTANAMFDLPALQVSDTSRGTSGLWIGEIVATAGLITVVVALVRTARTHLAAPVVAAYIGAAYWFTSSTAFANPAVSIGRIFSDTFAGISPGSVPGFVAAQVVGALLGLALVLAVAPLPRSGADMSTVPEVLFVCVHNAGRSQMAAALLRHHGGAAVRVTSAGSAPADQVNPAVRQVMAEIGIDLDGAVPRKLATGDVAAADVVITMGCGDACPVFRGKRYLDWELPDPAGRTAEEIRPIRDEIDARVRELLRELSPSGSAGASR
jgi:arsenate reductase